MSTYYSNYNTYYDSSSNSNNNYTNTNNIQAKISSPESTERLLFDYLRPQLEKTTQQLQQDECALIQKRQHEQKKIEQQQAAFITACWDDTFLSLEDEEDNNITIELNGFSDLQVALKDIEELETYPTSSQRARARQQQKRNNNNRNRWSTTEEDLINLSSSFTNFTVPPSVRLNVESSQMLDLLMHRAVQHWCCIGFKVAPISVNLIQDWRNAPEAIVYCIASISLVTFMDLENTSSNYSKQAAMVFYEQAHHKMDDILFDDMQPLIIQSYFCLSYTSNLLRLYDQQKTWGRLASISLQHLAKNIPAQKKPIDELTLGCWFRWYYVDAWMCLTLNRDCLLPDSVPWLDMKKIERLSIITTKSDQNQMYSFATLTYYMRRYIRALHSGKLFTAATTDQQKQRIPSRIYYQITQELTNWYSQLPKYTTIAELHLHLCYNSMRLVVLYQFLNPHQPPSNDVLIDCLQTNLELLQALQQLKDIGCDQSTYHHMFFSIHNTAKRIYQYNDNNKRFQNYAQEQLKINLMLLKSTQAYAHDVFKMKVYAEKIQDQFARLKIVLADDEVMQQENQLVQYGGGGGAKKKKAVVEGDTFVFRQNHHYHSNNNKSAVQAKNQCLLQQRLGPAVIVFKQENVPVIKRHKKS